MPPYAHKTPGRRIEMSNLKSYLLATVGIISLVASLTINVVRATNAEAPTITAATAHFNPGRIYLLSPANGGSQIKCKVTEVDGAWIRCEGEHADWVNTNIMMLARDAQ
jgi:hypothetical protein